MAGALVPCPTAVAALPVPTAVPGAAYVTANQLAALDGPTRRLMQELGDRVGVPFNVAQERAEAAAGAVRSGVTSNTEFRYTMLGPIPGAAAAAAVPAAAHLEFGVALSHYSPLMYTSISIKLPQIVWSENDAIENTPLEDICRILTQFYARESRRNSSLGDLLRDHAAAGSRARIIIQDMVSAATLQSDVFQLDDMIHEFQTTPAPGNIDFFMAIFQNYWPTTAAGVPNSDGADELDDGATLVVTLRIMNTPTPNLRWRHTQLARMGGGGGAAAAAAAGPAAPPPPPPPRGPRKRRGYGEGLYGGGPLTAEESAQRELVTRMRCLVRTEVTTDETCAAQTMVLAKAHAALLDAELPQKNPDTGKEETKVEHEARVYAARQEWKEWINRRKARDGSVRVKFATEARAFHQRVLPLGQRATIRDIQRMEELAKHRLILYRWTNERTALEVEYAGNTAFARYGVGLVFGQHIDYVTDVLALLRKSRKDTPFRLCLGCAEVVPVARTHQCEGRCPHCTLTHANFEAAEPAERLVCHNCHRTLRPGCYEAHLRENVCNLSWLCTKCNRVLVRAREQEADHDCENGKVCTKCFEKLEGPHQCYMGKLQPQKDVLNKVIVFDFETTQDNEQKQHVVNMAVAMYLHPDQLKPGVVAPEQQHDGAFVSFTSLDAFCKWLFQPKHKGFTAIAHNLRGYDGHFVLQWLDMQGVWTYKPTYRGTSIMGFQTVEPYRLKFADSYNHIAVALREFPKVFGLDANAFKKGDFPYLFNTEANAHYVGPLPPLDTFGERVYMSAERWEELSRWHAAEAVKAKPWDNAKELLEYCVNDVKLLREGLRHYQREMYALTKVDPLRKLTIASTAMTGFRTSFMAEKAIPLMSLHLQNLVREGYYGGFTEAFQPLRYFDEEKGEHGRAVDVCSMYPWAMFYNEFPVGHPELLQGPDLDLTQHRGFAKVTVVCPDQLLVPVLPSRGDGKLLFDLRGPKTGVWSTAELKFAQERGYRIVQTEWILTWREWSNELFRSYIRVFFLLKTLAGGPGKRQSEAEKKAYLEEHLRALEMTVLDPAVTQILAAKREEDGQDREEKENEGGEEQRWRHLVALLKDNATLKAISKLLLNSLYGKFAETPYNTVEQTKGAAQFYARMTDPNVVVLSVRPMSGDRAELNWKSVVPDAQTATDKRHVCVAVAALITAYARLRLLSAIETIGPARVMYCDTDSVYYVESPGDAPVVTSSTLGGLEDDLKGGKLVDFFVSTGPKAYGCRVRKPDGTCVDKIRLKGFPSVIGTQDVLSRCSLLRAWQEAEYKVEKTLRNFQKHRHTHQVVTVEMKRTFKNTFGKRQVLRIEGERNINSVPLGYRLE